MHTRYMFVITSKHFERMTGFNFKNSVPGIGYWKLCPTVIPVLHSSDGITKPHRREHLITTLSHLYEGGAMCALILLYALPYSPVHSHPNYKNLSSFFIYTVFSGGCRIFQRRFQKSRQKSCRTTPISGQYSLPRWEAS